MFPPTFNGLLDFSVLPLDLVYHFVLLLLLFPLSVFDLLLLPLLSLPLLRLVGVLCRRRRRGGLQVSMVEEHISILTPRQIYSLHTHATLQFSLSNPSTKLFAKCFTLAITLSLILLACLLQNVWLFPSSAATNSSLRSYLSCFPLHCNDLPIPFKTAAVTLQLHSQP